MKYAVFRVKPWIPHFFCIRKPLDSPVVPKRLMPMRETGKLLLLYNKLRPENCNKSKRRSSK